MNTLDTQVYKTSPASICIKGLIDQNLWHPHMEEQYHFATYILGKNIVSPKRMNGNYFRANPYIFKYQGHKLTEEEIDFWNANKLSQCSYTREDYKYYKKDPFIKESNCVWDVHLDYQNSVSIIESKTAFNFKNKHIRYSYMTSQSDKPRKMTAKEFNLEKKRWNNLKAEEA